MKRRDFIQHSALASVGSLLIPNFLKAYEQTQLFEAKKQNKILIIIQLSGGNDGLNTVVPFRNDIYYQQRPRLAISAQDCLKLNDEVGLNPALKALQAIYDEGQMSIINNVGYPNPDRSHFRSMDIWQSASASNEYLNTGWIGRYLDAACAGDCQNAHQALEIDDSLSLALKGEQIKGLALQNPDKLYRASQGRLMQAIAQQTPEHEHEQVQYLYKTLAETVSSAAYLQEKIQKITQSPRQYPAGTFGRSLRTIASLINAGADTEIYYTSLSGFDTHVNQKGTQERLLKQYAEATAALVKDLEAQGNLDRCLIMTFSEFGRRVAQNASNGTDHGTANNIFLMGGKLKKAGIYNKMPNLSELDNGDLKYEIDFRQIYATLLERHLQTSSTKILTQSFTPLNLI